MATLDISGQRFGRLVAVERTHGPGSTKWVCRCDCGETKAFYLTHLRRGNSTSCGCSKRRPNRSTRAYESWRAMRDRCTRPLHTHFRDYGGRGITVCERWSTSFDAFFADMGERPPGTSLERIDNSRGYEPDNCRWATSLEQRANTRANHVLTLDGETHHLAEWSRRTGIDRGTIASRLRRGWTVAEALTR